MRNSALTVPAWMLKMLLLGVMATASAQDSNWTAGSSTNLNWSNGANWSAGEPTLINNAIFPSAIPNPGSLASPGTILLSSGEQAQSLTFNGTGYVLSGGTLALASPGNVTVTTAAHTATINSVLNGSGGLSKLGAGTLVLGGANTFTGAARVLGGTLTIANGGSIGVASVLDSLQVAERSMATLTVQAGGQLQVGNGSSSFLYVGSRGDVTGTAATVGTLNLSAASSFTANVGEFYVGVGITNATGTTRGIVQLATNNTIAATTGVLVGDMLPSLDNSTVAAGVSQLNFGSGSNNVTTPTMIVGGSRSRGSSTLAAGGTLTLNNGAGATILHIGRQNIGNTATVSEGTMDLSQGTFIATLGAVIIGERSNGSQSGAGYATGTLSIGSSAGNNVTAASVVLGNLGTSAASTNTTQGTLNFGGGTFSVTGNVNLANHGAAGGLARALLNLTGGTFNVGGNIVKTNAKAESTAVIIVDGATLNMAGDMTAGTIASSQLAWRSGSIINVAAGGVTLDAHSATTGTGNTGDALIFRDVTINFAVTLTGASGGNVHYEAGNTTTGGTLAALNLGTVARTFNIEDNANAAIDTTISGIVSGSGSLVKTGAGTLRLTAANTYTGRTIINEGVLSIAAKTGLGAIPAVVTADSLTLNGGTLQTTATVTMDDSNRGVTLGAAGGTFDVTTGSTTLKTAITGDGGLVKTGTGTLVFSGAAANTYMGPTTVNQGSISLRKDANVTAIAGDISLLNDGDLLFVSASLNQLADNISVTINGDNSTFNGTATNMGTAIINETITALTVTRGVVNAGAASSSFTVSGASSFTGTAGITPATSTMFLGNSGSFFKTGSLSLTDMNGSGGTEAANSFTLYGNSATAQTTVQVGAGGFILNNSNLYLYKGTSAGTPGSRLILDGNITVNGASPSAIVFNSGSIGVAEVELSSTAGSVTRTFETNADLSINPEINNGEATTAGITKTGTGKLTLSGTNTYNGHTQVDAGTLSIAASANLGDASATNDVGLGSNTTLEYTAATTTDLTANRDIVLGSGAVSFDITQVAGNLVVSGDVTGAGTGTFTKTGAGTLTLTGANISGLNNRGLNLAQGGLSFENGLGQAINLGAGVLHLGNLTTLTLEVGSLAAFDSINSTAAAAVDSGATINLDVKPLSGLTSNTTYNLISAGAGSGFNAAGLTWNLSLPGSIKYQLNLTDTLVQLQTLAEITGDAYWRGDVGGSWSTVILGATNNTNWATTLAGTTDREAGPGADTTVYFSAANAAGPAIATTLDNNVAINDLVFLASPSGITSVSIAQGTRGTLTIAPSAATAGIRLEDNAGAISISAPVELGAAQTWNVSATGASLTVSGSISGEAGATLTKTGAGTLTLTGNSTYTGRTIINQGTVSINSEAALGGNPAAFTADQLLLNGGTLQSTANFAINDTNRGISLGASGGSFNTNASTTLTVNNVISGSGNLTKAVGTGTLVVTNANTYTGVTNVLNGTLRIGSGGSIGVAGATAGSLKVADRSTATMTADAGGSLKVGSGSSSYLYVGVRTDDVNANSTVGTLNLSASSNFTANVGKFYVGGSDTTSVGTTGTAIGIVTLAQNNTITASTEILVGQMSAATANQGVTSQFNFGSGINNITTPSFTLGGRKSAATSVIGAGGVLNLANGVGKTDLYIGRNNNAGTATQTSGSLNLTGGTFNATLGKVIIGERSDNNGAGSGASGGGTGSGTGTLTLGTGSHVITADSLILGNHLTSNASALTTQGNLNMADGTFTIAGNVGLGINTATGGNSTGTLNLTGGTFTVGGNITSSNKSTAGNVSTAIVTLDGGTLDMTNGSIDANTLNARSGALKDVSQIFSGNGSTVATLTKTTAGTLVLLGTNNYTGATVVSGGVLEVRGTTGTGTTTVQTTGTLAGAGIIQGSGGTTVESGGTLKAGNNLGNDIGTITFNSSLALNAGSTSVFQLSGATGTVSDPLTSIGAALLNGTPGNHDHVEITGSLTLGATSTIAVSLVGYNASYGDVFNLFDWSAAGSANANGFNPLTGFDFSAATLDAGWSWDTSRFLSDGVIAVVPEPSRCLLLFLGMLACVLRRRR